MEDLKELQIERFETVWVQAGLDEMLWGDRPSACVLSGQQHCRRMTTITQLEVCSEEEGYRMGQVLRSTGGMGTYADRWYEHSGVVAELLEEVCGCVRKPLGRGNRMALGVIEEEEILESIGRYEQGLGARCLWAPT